VATKKAKASSTKMTTYMIEFAGGKQKRVTVPAEWKVTFGPLAPGSKGYENNGEKGLCLRMYENQSQQRAVFTKVASFRDMSIHVEERVVHRRNERAQRETPNGVKDFVVQAEYAEWRTEGDDAPGFDPAFQLPKLDDEDDDLPA
jgi:hypothetical protein